MILLAIISLLLFAFSNFSYAQSEAGSDAGGISKIKHVIWIIQENHSYDNYFGTFPNVDGLVPTMLIAD